MPTTEDLQGIIFNPYWLCDLLSFSFFSFVLFILYFSRCLFCIYCSLSCSVFAVFICILFVCLFVFISLCIAAVNGVAEDAVDMSDQSSIPAEGQTVSVV